MPKAIHWFRRDLRIADNTALHPASKNGTVIPVYLLSDWKGSHHWTGSNRQQFLCDCLESLAKNLGTLGGRLIIREGDAVSALEMLIRETAAETIYYNRDPDPFDKRTETRLHELCSKLSISCHGYDDVALHNPYEVLTRTRRARRTEAYGSRSLENRPQLLVAARHSIRGRHLPPLPGSSLRSDLHPHSLYKGGSGTQNRVRICPFGDRNLHQTLDTRTGRSRPEGIPSPSGRQPLACGRLSPPLPRSQNRAQPHPRHF